MPSSGINVFGADWCHDTRHTRAHLEALGIEYSYINVDDDPAAREWVEMQNDGRQKLPTVDVGGLVLSVPSDGELDAALRRQNFLTRAQLVDDTGPDPLRL